jgi:chromosome segregation ATPase
MFYFNVHFTLRQCLILLLTIGSSGCATNPDPQQGGFINGIAGLAGGYQRRIDERQDTYHGEVRAGEQLQTEAAALAAQREQLRSSLDQAQNRLIQLENRIERARAALVVQKQQQQAAAVRAQQARLVQAQAQVVKTKRQLATLRPRIPTATAPTVASLKQQSQALQHELDAIDELVGVIAE